LDTFYAISYTYIITLLKDVHITRPHKWEALDEMVVEEQGDQQWLDMTERFRCIRDHVLDIMGGGVVEKGIAALESSNAILQDVQGGKIYCCRCARGGRVLGLPVFIYCQCNLWMVL